MSLMVRWFCVWTDSHRSFRNSMTSSAPGFRNPKTQMWRNQWYLDKGRKEEEQERLKMEVKLKKKLLYKVNRAIIKDYIQFFFLLLSSSLNFNYLFLPFIFIGVIYLTCIGNFKFRLMRLKYFLEIFVIGYASYLLMFKLTIFTLIKNENENVLVTHKNLLIDLGICILKDRDSYYNFIKKEIHIL